MGTFSRKDLTSMRAYWEDFRKKCVPPGASKFQVLDTQAAFYCGAQALIWLIMDIEPDQANNQIIARFKEISDEIQDYFDPKVAAAVLEALDSVVH